MMLSIITSLDVAIPNSSTYFVQKPLLIGENYRPTIIVDGCFYVSMLIRIRYRYIIWIWHPTGMSYLFYFSEQNTKHKRGKITNIRDFGWILVICLVELFSLFRPLGKLRGCSWVSFGLAVTNQLTQENMTVDPWPLTNHNQESVREV